MKEMGRNWKRRGWQMGERGIATGKERRCKFKVWKVKIKHFLQKQASKARILLKVTALIRVLGSCWTKNWRTSNDFQRHFRELLHWSFVLVKIIDSFFPLPTYCSSCRCGTKDGRRCPLISQLYFLLNSSVEYVRELYSILLVLSELPNVF